MCFWERNLIKIWWIWVPNSNQVKMRLDHKFWHAQSRFLNNSPSVFSDFRCCEATNVTNSDPKINAKLNARQSSIFGTVFHELWDQNVSQIGPKLLHKSSLVGDVILERFWGDSAANGAEVSTPRGVVWGGVEGTFLGRRPGRRTNTHAWFTP